MMNEKEIIPTLDQIKENLLAVRNDTNFNIGSPAAIDHLLISIVLVIDAIKDAGYVKAEKRDEMD